MKKAQNGEPIYQGQCRTAQWTLKKASQMQTYAAQLRVKVATQAASAHSLLTPLPPAAAGASHVHRRRSFVCHGPCGIRILAQAELDAGCVSCLPQTVMMQECT